MFLDYPVDIEISANADVEFLGGYGGGQGGVAAYTDYAFTSILLPATGGSGGWPYGDAGVAPVGAGTPYFVASSGAAGSKTTAGLTPQTNAHRYGDAVFHNGTGKAGLPIVSTINLAYAENAGPFAFINHGELSLFPTLPIYPDAQQGIGVINEGNMNVTALGAWSVLRYNTASGYTTLTG
jgi:hypothetical protein